jgi:DNA (cytosine-5)-methyltransferase 1
VTTRTATARPVLYDLGCGAGGIGSGYHAAGWRVIGFDIAPQPRYPFEFRQADALTVDLSGADAVHASMPCERWSLASRYTTGDWWPDLITPLRPRLEAAGKPWVIENVPGAPLRPDVKLCGCYFGLEAPGTGQLLRERWFETSWRAQADTPPHDHHAPAISIAGHGTPAWQRKITGHVPVAVWRQVMTISWTTRAELAQAVPPAYGLFMGALLMAHLQTRKAA